MKIVWGFLLFSLIFSLSAVSQATAAEMEATIRVSGGGTYDYFVIGMRRDATDGFDNLFDTLAPAFNLNETYISTYISHPEWDAIKDDFRADIRSVGQEQEWIVTVYTNLAPGTPLRMETDSERSHVPGKYIVYIEDVATGSVVNLEELPYEFSVTADRPFRDFTVFAYRKGGKKQKQ
jgi:hypothetical protein